MSIWTDDNIALLKRLWPTGLSCAQIAQQIPGATKGAVGGQVHRLGLPPRRPGRPDTAATLGPRAVVFRPSPPRRFTWQHVADDAQPAGSPAPAPPRSRTCSWPLSEAPGRPTFFCGDNTFGGPFCPTHAAIGHLPAAVTKARHARVTRLALRCA